jgi:uncharacterized membrane protein (DUF2068 family)
MIDALAFAVALLAAGTAIAVGVAAARRGYRRAAFGPAVGVLQSGLVVQAVLDVVGLARGHHPGEPATHLAYLVASLIVLPLAAYETRRDDGGWSAVVLAGALVVVAVLVVRMEATWRSG